jgi:hypothetical protein
MAGFGIQGADRSGSAGFVVGGAAIPASGGVLGADHDIGDYAVLTGCGARGFVAAFRGNCCRALVFACSALFLGPICGLPAIGSSLLPFWRYNAGDPDVGAEGGSYMANRFYRVAEVSIGGKDEFLGDPARPNGFLRFDRSEITPMLPKHEVLHRQVSRWICGQ